MLFSNGILSEHDNLEDYFPKTIFAEVESWFQTDQDISSYMIYSPRGSGKSTFARHVFSKNRRRQFASENKVLVQFCFLSDGRLHTDADVFCRLIEGVETSIDVLSEEQRDILSHGIDNEKQKAVYSDYRQDRDKSYDLLKAITQIFRNNGYYVVLIFDDFHLLTNSKTCATDTFNNLAALSQNRLLSYIVLTDYHVTIASDRYRLSQFERVFSARIFVPKIKKGKYVRAVQGKIRETLRIYQDEIEELDAAEQIEIPDEIFRWIWEDTDGIPGLIQRAVSAYYNVCLNNRGIEFDETSFKRMIFQECKSLMWDWIKYLGEEHWKTIEIIYDHRDCESTTRLLEKNEDKANELIDSELIQIDRASQTYEFTCPMFERFIAGELKRPEPQIVPKGQTVPLPAQRIGDLFGSLGQQIGSITINQTNYIGPSTHLHITPTSVSEMLGLLQQNSGNAYGFATALAEKYCHLEYIEAHTAEHPIEESENASVALAHDERFDQFSSQVIQDIEVDEDHEMIDISPAELQTLDMQFEQARNRRKELTDEMLSMLSERCQLYLKLSVVVEHALSFIHMDDCSPQLVLYGKALEQALRDNLYDLFHGEATLREYEVDKRVNPPVTFEGIERERSFISSYQFLIRDCCEYLAKISNTHEMRYNSQIITQEWWKRFNTSVHEARCVRNMADHAGGVSPQQSSVNDICRYLFGTPNDTGGILSKVCIGSMLWGKIQHVDKYLNREPHQITIISKKEDGRIQGLLPDCDIPVKISKAKVKSFCPNINDPSLAVGKILKVHLLEYVRNGDSYFFSGEIV